MTNSESIARFEYDIPNEYDQVECHTKTIGEWLQAFVGEDQIVFEAQKDEILGRLQSLQGDDDFKFPVFAYSQKGDIIPAQERYQHHMAYIGELIKDPNDEEKVYRYKTFPINIPYEIYMLTNSIRMKAIWTKQITTFFWKRPSLRVTFPFWNLKAWSQFELLGMSFDDRIDPNSAQYMMATSMCQLKTSFRDRVEVPITHKFLFEYNELNSSRNLEDQVVDEKGDRGGAENLIKKDD